MKATKKVEPIIAKENLMVTKKVTPREFFSLEKRASLDFTFEYFTQHIENFTFFDYEEIKPHLKNLHQNGFLGLFEFGKKAQEDLARVSELLMENVSQMSYEAIFRVKKGHFWMQLDAKKEFQMVSKKVQLLYELILQELLFLKSALLKTQKSLEHIQKVYAIFTFLIQESEKRAIFSSDEIADNLALMQRMLSLSTSKTIAIQIQQSIENRIATHNMELLLCEKYINAIKPSLENLLLIDPKRFEKKLKYMLK